MNRKENLLNLFFQGFIYELLCEELCLEDFELILENLGDIQDIGRYESVRGY